YKAESDSKATAGELLFRHRFTKPGNTLSLSFNYDISETKSEAYNISETNFYGERERTELVNQFSTQNSNRYALNGRLSYTQPLGGEYFMEFAYRYRYNRSDSDKEAYNFNQATNKYDIQDIEYSNFLKNITIEQQAEINLRSNQEKYNYTVGFSALPSYISSIGETGGVARDFARHRFNFTPRVDFRYNFAQNTTLRVEYNGRTNQPSLTQLQPVKDNSDPTRIREGNLDLTPEFSNRFSLDYRNTKPGTFRTISLRSDMNYTLNKIINKSEYIEGVLYTKPVNEGTSFSGNLFLTYNSPIAQSKFTISSSGGLNTSSSNSYSNGVKNHTNTLGVRETLRFNYRGDKLNATISGSANYSVAWYSIEQNGNNNTWNNRLSADFNWTLPWGLNLTSDISHLFYIGYPQGYNKPSTVWNATGSKLLLKNMGTLAIRVFDIFKESKSISHNVSDNYIEDSESNVLSRYFIFSFTYRFGTFSGSRNRGDWHGPSGGPGQSPMMRTPGQRF
ncbi:MAG: outer membrane beta-barrel family protein, partial [Prevotellaceae bacterium]|nr:outer membrane beta-barrel family protein [Prevotellaceae bacterium]